ncbi:hypothetical protein Tco_0360466 [Tanacetum coccineum]
MCSLNRIINTTKEQQKELDDALVAPKNRLKIGKSNLRLSSNLKSKEPTLQVVLDALKLTPFYNAFEISADVPKIYMQEFWVTVTRHHSSLRFKLNSKSHTINVDNFRDMLKIFPKLPGQKFEEPPLEEDILSFIRDLGHTGEIKFLSDVNVNHMHQPWRSFAAIINKCLSGKTTALENLVFQVENKNSKKNNDMYYPRFTKVIVDYFMAKDQAIPRRNKMFWHYARDDFMFTTIRVISKHKDTQEYGAILPQHLTNQAMLESEAFMTYRAYATGEKAPKFKTSAKGDKPSTTKSKGLTVLSKVALSEAEQMKLATKRSLTKFYVSHASGSGDGVDLQSESEQNEDDDEHNNDEDDDEHDSDDDNEDNDDDQDNNSERTKSDNDGDDFVHPKLSTYKADDQEEENEDEKANDDEDQNQEDKDYFINPSPDTGINSILNPNAAVSVTPSSATIIPQTPILIIQPQQQTYDSTTKTTILITTMPEIPNFASLFGFECRVSLLESDLSELKQTNQFAEALSSILGIVDKYLETKVKDIVDVAVQLKSDKLREEALAENQDFLNLIDSNMKRIIKEQVKAQTSKIMTKVEKYVTETLGAEVLNLYRALLEAYNSDKDLLSSYGERQRLGKEESSKEATQKKSKSTSSSKGTTRSSQKSSGKSIQEEEHDPRVDDLEEPFHQEFDTINDDVSPVREATDVDERLWNPSGSQTPDRE